LEGERKSPTAECPQQANATTFGGVYTETELKHRRRIYRYRFSIRSSFIAMPTNLGAYRRGIPRTRETVRPPVRSYQALYSLGIWFWQPNQGLFTQKQPIGGNLHQSRSRTETLSHGPSASLCPSILNLPSNPDPPFGENHHEGNQPQQPLQLGMQTLPAREHFIDQ
jgi:hypothetical protein